MVEVAVKALKGGSSEENTSEFMQEASVMAPASYALMQLLFAFAAGIDLEHCTH